MPEKKQVVEAPPPKVITKTETYFICPFCTSEIGFSCWHNDDQLFLCDNCGTELRLTAFSSE